MITYEAEEGNLMKAVKQINEFDIMKEPTVVIRIEDIV